tara:strand:- start:193 stop:408 length:216 start_codon:yes stop_codon:yes gene_type:complete
MNKTKLEEVNIHAVSPLLISANARFGKTIKTVIRMKIKFFRIFPNYSKINVSLKVTIKKLKFILFIKLLKI